MNNFIKKTGLFILFILFILVSFIFSVHYFIKVKSNFEINKNYKYVVFGHSHAEVAFNDSLITNFKNLSSSGEAYFYTFQKVKKILSQNNQINTIFVEYSNNQIDKVMNNWIWGNEMISVYFPRYSPFMNKLDFQLLYRKNSKDFFSVLSKSTRVNFVKIITFDFAISNKYGGYQWIERNMVDSLSRVSDDSLRNKVNEKQDISNINIEYLKKIVDYCIDNNVKIYLIRSPQHRNFSYLKNEISFIKIKKTKFHEIEFLDFNNFPLTNDKFGDFGHLNHKGAKTFSIFFNSLIEDGLLMENDKQVYINKKMLEFKTKVQ